MDYILKQIEENITLYSHENKVKIYHQIRAEYCILLLFAYLWDKKILNVSFGKKKRIIEKIQKPTIGAIVNLAKELDIENEFFKDQNSEIFDYIEIRNNNIGHGYCFDDNFDDFIKQFDEYYQSLRELNIPIINNDTSLIFITDYKNDLYTGLNYSPTGTILPWSCSKKIKEFKIHNVYASYQVNEYFRISPFVHIEHPRKFFLFNSIDELLLGRIVYNRIDETTERKVFIWEEIYKEFASTDGIRRRTANNTIINIFDNNYSSFIDVGLIKDSVIEFLNGKKRKSSVCATLWGHGGVGKTATVQNVCEQLSNDVNIDKNDRFDYIVFLSAKDRRYDFNLAKVQQVEANNRVVTYEDLIRKINSVLFKDDSSNIKSIQEFDGRVLIIVDDFETFDDSEKEKIIEFIELLDINHHKVIITTRNKFLVVGKEISTNELDIKDTQVFLLQVLEKYYKFNKQRLDGIAQELNTDQNESKLHTITSGRPLFIFVFANYLVQTGTIKLAFNDVNVINIKTNDEANEFLFGKVYDQLASDSLAKEIFVTIGLLTPEDRLSSLKSHLEYIVNAPSDTEFENSLGKLIDLKIIEIYENTFYKVYSKEILSLMKEKLDSHKSKRRLTERFLKIQKNIHKETGEALLLNADNSRFSEKPEEFVISSYKEVIRLNYTDKKVKARALLNLTDYLYNQRGNKSLAVQSFEDFPNLLNEPECVIQYSQYAWSLKEKKYTEKSIEILSDYFHNLKQNKVRINQETRLQILALIVLRKCILGLDQDYKEQDLRQIYNVHGNILFVETKKIDLNKVEPNVRQDVLIALVSLIDVCFKVRDFKKHANEIICHVLEKIDRIPTHIKQQFETRHKTLTKEPIKFNIKKQPIRKTFAIQNTVYRGNIKKNGLMDGYGFIEVDELDKDIYFHKSSLKGINFEDLWEYDLVDVIIKVYNGRYSILNDYYTAWSVKSVY